MVRVERGVGYGGGKALDVYWGRGEAVVLLWHGVGPDERDVLAPLATAAAELGVTVLVPDWRSDAHDGGRAQLLGSIGFARRLAAHPDAIVLAGWSRGGKAAAEVALSPGVVGGWRPAGVVCLGAGFSTPGPITGVAPAEELARTAVTPVPFWLVHGTVDPVVAPAGSERFAGDLAARGWPVSFERPETDHAGVVMAVYDFDRGRCRAAVDGVDGPALAAGRRTAQLLALAAGPG